MNDLQFDHECVPYPRKGLYWLINIPYLVLLIITAIYLWQFGILVSLIYSSFYILSVILHGYVCAFSGCPYKGTFCPGSFAYFPVGKMALLFDKMNIKKSDLLFNLFFGIIMLLLLGIIIFPLYWINRLGVGYTIGYLLIILIYFTAFILTICPKCAMRFNCPMAKLSNLIYKG